MRYENQAFVGEELVLDGNEFINCTFEDCKIVYSALPGPGGKIEPLSAKGFQLEFRGAAKTAMTLHQEILEAGVSQAAPMGGYLRVGSAWFQRVPTPSGVGAAAGRTAGLEVVAFPGPAHS